VSSSSSKTAATAEVEVDERGEVGRPVAPKDCAATDLCCGGASPFAPWPEVAATGVDRRSGRNGDHLVVRNRIAGMQRWRSDTTFFIKLEICEFDLCSAIDLMNMLLRGRGEGKKEKAQGHMRLLP
jgi:hypothetical protein